MPEEFDIQKLKSEYPEFFEQIPSELLEFILSEEFSSTVAQVCLENEVTDEEKIEKIASRVVLALFGEIPQRNLAEILERGVKLNRETAEKIHLELNRLIFSQFREARPVARPSPPVLEEAEEEKLEKPPKKDIYREPVE